MSRRKQAKPRACLKLGEKAEEDELADGDAGLLEPKEEVLSDVESADEEDEQDEQQANEENVNQRNSAATLTEQANDEKFQVNNNNNESKKNVSVTSAGAVAAAAASVAQQHSSSDDLERTLTAAHADDDGDEYVNNADDIVVDNGELELNDDELHDDELDEDDEDVDDDELDEDLQSIDSFYSDMYSTHTSSSYSPSISDGTLTPNSLHLPPTTMTTTAGLPQQHDEQQQQQQQQQLKGNAEIEVDKDLLEAKKRQGQRHHHHHQQQQQQQQPHHHHHALKLAANKLRKIDKNASAAGTGTGTVAANNNAKFDKLTGESLKNCRPDGSYQCQFCDKSFPRLGYLKKHEQSHAEHLPFKCDYCARLFKHKRSRDRHTKLHTGDRRYRCPHCEAAFSRSDHLKIHMKTHDNQKPFQCTICNRGYNTAAALTSHMQNHKKQAAILAAGGNPQALNYSPRSTGSASSNGSLHKRRYAMAIASDSSPSRMEFPKRARSALLRCNYCHKSEWSSLEQLNAHVQSLHEKDAQLSQQQQQQQQQPPPTENVLQLSCEYCTMKFGSIAALFQHMRSTHIDRLTSPNSYFEHFNRLATSGTFSPRLALAASMQQQHIDIKMEPSPKTTEPKAIEEEPTDLSQHKRRSASPMRHSPPAASSPQTPEKPGVFFCNQCNAGLPDFESFRSHLKSHIVEGLNLVCHHCGMALPDQQEYERHVIGHFLISNSEYNCTANCSKSYAKQEELQKHLMEQHVITMYKCALCAELFESKVSIQVHFACAHSAETKLLRCSACMEVFRAEADFHVHVKTRHQLAAHSLNNNGTLGGGGGGGMGGSGTLSSLQCMFCRAVCASELEMHFHLAAHARQFRCPSCPETFHVEFLLDRHMQSHHGGGEERERAAEKEAFEEANTQASASLSPMNSLYVNALFGGKPPGLLPPLSAQTNNNNSIIDYNVAFAAAHLQKGLFPPPPPAAAAKFYSPLQVDTASAMKQHPALMYGLSQRYFDTNRTLMDMYAAQQEKNAANSYFVSPKAAAPSSQEATRKPANDLPNQSATPALPGFSCGLCERNDFRTEAEVHSHRKIVHNMKTGVSLRCAYCCGNFKSRSELEHHMKTCHNSTGKHKCLICDEVFPSPAILAEHKLQHSKVGQSGKCSHCGKPLADVAAFKEHLSVHNNEGQLPVQCICCRQTLHSDFEISLHAKFHTKSGNSLQEGAVCALCLEPIPSVGEPQQAPAKVCEQCCRKHNLNNKQRKRSAELTVHGDAGQYIENRCNLCKMILPHASKLQEHLIEHTFAGTEERGFNCYICSAVFTAPAGLLNHMNEQHGANARPYDCNLCTDKFYFRSELDHHLREHELRPSMAMARQQAKVSPMPTTSITKEEQQSPPSSRDPSHSEVKQELFEPDQTEQQHSTANNNGEDDEYIEVEKVADTRTEHESPQEQQLASSSP